MLDKTIKIPKTAFDVISDLLPGGVIKGDGFEVDFSPVKSFKPDWKRGTITLSPPAKVQVIVRGIKINTTISYMKKDQDQSYVYLEVDNSPIDVRFEKE